MITSEKLKFLNEFNIEDRIYCHLPTAILGASAIGAGASIFGASKAADAQTNAANMAIANQRQMYGLNKQVLDPFISAGADATTKQTALLDPTSSGALKQLLALTGGGPGGPDAMNTALASTPGYQFNLTQGNMAVNNALAARGLGGSGGAVAKGAAQYTQGLAGNTWQSVVQALQNTFNSQLTGGQNLINSGVTAGSALAGVGTNTANSITGSLTGAGNAQAAAANAIGTGVGNAANSVPSALLLQQLLGRNNNVNGGTSLYGPQAGQITLGTDAGPTPFG